MRAFTLAVFLGVFGTWIAATGCASLTSAVTTEALPDGTIRLKCKSSLATCLVHAEEACKGNRYKVLAAVDQHDYLGPQSTAAVMESRAAEAIVKCGSRGKSLFGEDDSALPPLAGTCSADPVKATDAAKDPKAAAPATCVAGATQECLGPGACKGAQACLPDRSGYSACDCGSAGKKSEDGGTN